MTEKRWRGLAIACLIALGTIGAWSTIDGAEMQAGNDGDRVAACATLRQLPPAARSELLKAREAVWRAWFSWDTAALKKLLPEETIALESGANGWTTRDTIIAQSAGFANGGNRLVSIEFPRTEMQVYGATAIIYTSYAFVTEAGGKRGGEKGKAIEIFVRRPEGWVNSGWQLMPDSQP